MAANNQNITQITNQQATFDPTTIVYGVPISTGLDTTFTGQVFRTWLFNNPTFTGTVTIPSGASIAGYAPLASPTFTGTIGGGAASINLGGTASFASIQATPVGSTTASSGAFTTLTNSGAFTVNGSISGPGVNLLLASPPSIGNTAAASGAFTTLSASSTVSGTGFSTYLASPPSIGSTAAGSGAFTTLSASSTVSGTGFSTYLASPPAIGGTTAAAGSFTTLSSTGNFTPSQTNGIVGTTTNNNANAGSVGEYVTATGTAVSVTTATPTNITSISLTAGDWEVQGSIAFSPAGTTVPSVFIAGTNNTSATLAAAPFNTVSQLTFPTGLSQAFPVPSQRYSLSATTTIFLIGQSTFTTSTMTATGTIRARRVR